MALPGDELRRRIVSAAALHGWGLRELREQLENYGANKHMAERMIAGKVPQSRANVDALASLLEVPATWFEADDWRSLLSDDEAGESDLAELLHALRSDVQRQDLAATKERAELRTALENVRSHLGLDAGARESQGG